MSNVNFLKLNKNHQKFKVSYSYVNHNRVIRYLNIKAIAFYDGLSLLTNI